MCIQLLPFWEIDKIISRSNKHYNFFLLLALITKHIMQLNYLNFSPTSVSTLLACHKMQCSINYCLLLFPVKVEQRKSKSLITLKNTLYKEKGLRNMFTKQNENKCNSRLRIQLFCRESFKSFVTPQKGPQFIHFRNLNTYGCLNIINSSEFSIVSWVYNKIKFAYNYIHVGDKSEDYVKNVNSFFSVKRWFVVLPSSHWKKNPLIIIPDIAINYFF